ncbi:DUF2314 domain-containing protein [Uliginosibacterium gangwonense]|uniref:DUF2314 domain-containing protein n=1 Tax=Uliginosibacterium gangwonense TaxID=392736 RepID=UPI0003600F7B|nr:DUF2314 domain-containing protein [Uliginosibacterium gangwonense]
MSTSPIYSFDHGEAAMQRAVSHARNTFKFFWRELSWEYRRIVPGLGFAAVKIAFETDSRQKDAPPVEHMWISDIQFDGITVSGILVNSPEWVSTVQEGDAVSAPLQEIQDWMYSLGDQAYGGFTVDVIRAGMTEAERADHDAAWGLEFGAPGSVLIAQYGNGNPPARLEQNAQDANPDLPEHPMSENMKEKIEEALQADSSHVRFVDAEGWSMLHREALAGNHAPVMLLLKHGADPLLKTPDGRTALDLAKAMGWPRIIAALAG